MGSRKINPGDVEEMLALWRKVAGAEWEKSFRQLMEIHRHSYADGGNPLDAWSALLLAHALGEPPPAWVMEYLAICSTRLHGLTHAALQGEKFKPKDIAHAVGLVSMGAGTVFPSENEFVWVALAMQVRDCISNGDKETYAIEAVAKEYGVTKYAARQAWKRLQTVPELCGKS